jgi:Lecithin retinol acyltransferase/PspA/IM30 family
MAKGDQIYVYREWANLDGLYEHHGIDCGDNSVIHYRKPSETIERTSLNVFARGNVIYIREYSDGFSFLSDHVVERAESRLGEQKYNLLFNNCEHFATWCKTGISYSKQISKFAPSISKLKIPNLYQEIKTSLNATDSFNSKNLVDQALDDIKVVWDQLQPQYKQTLEEINTWQKVAKKALENDREDLAREALKRKLNYQKQAENLQIQLQKLAEMTKQLIIN